MATLRYKPPQNYRAAPVQVSTPEPFDVSGGVALLSEAPADPSLYPVTVLINGSPRTRVTGTPAAGQYRILTQAVIGSDGSSRSEYLPVLQFSVADEGLPGTASYYQTGTVLTAEFFATLLAFLTPLVVTTTADLPQATATTTLRGRPGDTAFVTSDGTSWWSDGVSWRQLTGNTLAISGELSLGQTIALALDGGYVGPSLTGAHSFDATHGLTLDADFAAANAYNGALSLDGILGLSMDAVAAQVADASFAQTMGLTLDGAWAVSGALTLGQILALALDASYTAPAPAGVSLVAAGSLAHFTDGVGTVPLPAGYQAGDIFVLVGTICPTKPTGWTLKASGGYFDVLWRRATSSETGPSVDAGGDEVGPFPYGGRIFAFRGCVTSGDPFDATSGTPTSPVFASSATGASLTTLDKSLLGMFVNADTVAVTGAGGSADSLIAATAGNFSLGFAYKSGLTSAGVQAAPTATLASAGYVGFWTFALKAA